MARLENGTTRDSTDSSSTIRTFARNGFKPPIKLTLSLLGATTAEVVDEQPFPASSLVSRQFSDMRHEVVDLVCGHAAPGESVRVLLVLDAVCNAFESSSSDMLCTSLQRRSIVPSFFPAAVAPLPFAAWQLAHCDSYVSFA